MNYFLFIILSFALLCSEPTFASEIEEEAVQSAGVVDMAVDQSETASQEAAVQANQNLLDLEVISAFEHIPTCVLREYIYQY